jgi:hypothetical protein
LLIFLSSSFFSLNMDILCPIGILHKPSKN